MNHDEIFNRWTSWLNTIHEDIQSTLVQRYIWKETQGIVTRNPSIHQDRTFFDWMAQSYISSVVLGVRRQLDRNTSSVSLLRLLEDIRDNPNVMSRERYLATYGEDTLSVADEEFDEFAGKGKPHIDPNLIEGDIEELRVKCASIRTFVNKRIAHTDQKEFDSFPTFNELDECLDLLEDLVKKNLLLIRAQTHTSIVPTWQFDWTIVFQQPWIQEVGT